MGKKTEKVKTVTFRLAGAPRGAKKIFLAGAFNNWSTDADRMTKDAKGVWTRTKRLAPGTYEYKFVVDGEWITDPECAETVFNEHGTLNSVIRV
ncbi:MAG: glycogen-binding domain-containing protein [bacterium]